MKIFLYYTIKIYTNFLEFFLFDQLQTPFFLLLKFHIITKSVSKSKKKEIYLIHIRFI